MAKNEKSNAKHENNPRFLQDGVKLILLFMVFGLCWLWQAHDTGVDVIKVLIEKIGRP